MVIDLKKKRNLLTGQRELRETYLHFKNVISFPKISRVEVIRLGLVKSCIEVAIIKLNRIINYVIYSVHCM